MAHPYYGLNELREMFLSYFESKGHLRLPSFSLIPPANDKSLLLINSGMAPMKTWFTREEEPPRGRGCWNHAPAVISSCPGSAHLHR